MTAQVRVQRVLAATPLARQHERGLAGKVTRRVPAIDWKAFDRTRYPEAALRLAAHAQAKLALHHADYAMLAARMLGGEDPREKQRIADVGGSILVRLEKQFWRGRDAEPKARKAARALGVLESEGQRRAVNAVSEGEMVPALDAMGLGASHAWRIRERGA